MKDEALIGRTIAGKYEIVTLVGQGAMGAVYKAKQISLGTTLALKVLHRHLAGEPMFAARFLREAQAASRVDHPSSMRVIDFGEEPDGLLYIAMELVAGKTLARVIEQDSPLPVARIVDIACQALAALAVAHDIGVIHRDLKPENIMVIEGQDDEGHTHDIVKVCDFGVAKLLEGGARAPSVTAQGVVVGTPEYMSPEQARGEALDARSDIYAMGVLLFQLMTGKVPFDSSTAFGTALMHVNDEPTRPRLLNPRVDSRLEKICLKAMRKRPSERYASARELRAELRALLGQDDAYSDEAPSSHSFPESARVGGLLEQIEARPRRTGLVMAGVVAAASVVAGAILYPRASSAPPPERMQSTSIMSGTLPAKTRTGPTQPPPAVPSTAPQIVDTTQQGTPGADATTTAPSPATHVHGMPRTNARRGTSKGHGEKAGAGAPIPIGVEEIPQLPDPSALDPSGKGRAAKADKATNKDAAKAAEAPAAQGKPAPVPASEKPAAPSDKPKPATDNPAPDKPAASEKPKPVEKPAAPAKPDPADAPLPVFPIPSPEAP
jgi:serine/threonine-protein kinase